jgi:ATP-dependent DNA helicase RecG
MAQFENQSRRSDATLPYIAMAKSLLYLNHVKEAHQVLERMPPVQKIDDTVEAAILKKKAKDFQGAHILLEKAYSIAPDNPKILHEFAQTKIKLAGTIQGKNDFKIKKRLHLEAVELLRKAIQLADNSMREAWCWLDLAAALDWLKAPMSEVEAAFLRAQSLQPDDEMFLEAYKQWQDKNKS